MPNDVKIQIAIKWWIAVSAYLAVSLALVIALWSPAQAASEVYCQLHDCTLYAYAGPMCWQLP